MSKPLVSVIVPICNVEKYVGRCLESLQAQTLRNIEIVCVDDGSTDASGNIADSFANTDDRFRVIHKPNSGYGHTMNLGFRQAKADYVAILESDDFAAPYMLEKLYDAAKEQNVQIVKANHYAYEGDIDKSEKVDRVGDYVKYGRFSPDDHPEFMLNNPSVWDALYRRDFIEKNEICFLESPGASYQDVGFLCKCWYTVDSVACIDDAIVYYRIDNPNSSIRNRRKVYCICDEYKEVKEYINAHTKAVPRAKLALAEMMYTNYFHSYHRIDFPFKYGFVTEWYRDTIWLRDNGYLDEQAILDDGHRRSMEELMENMDDFYDHISEYNWFMTAREAMKLWENVLRVSWNLTSEGAFARLKDAEDVFIYGAGTVAKEALAVLKRHSWISKLCGFCVTDKAGNPDMLEGFPVYAIEEMTDGQKESLIVVAVTFKAQGEITEVLLRNGFSHIMNYTDELRNRLKDTMVK